MACGWSRLSCWGRNLERDRNDWYWFRSWSLIRASVRSAMIASSCPFVLRAVGLTNVLMNWPFPPTSKRYDSSLSWLLKTVTIDPSRSPRKVAPAESATRKSLSKITAGTSVPGNVPRRACSLASSCVRTRPLCRSFQRVTRLPACGLAVAGSPSRSAASSQNLRPGSFASCVMSRRISSAVSGRLKTSTCETRPLKNAVEALPLPLVAPPSET